MSTLAVVEQILRDTKVPMSVREIVEHAGETLPTKSKTPDTVVARDLSMDIKKRGEDSLFIRTAPGRYTMRDYREETRPVTTDVVAAALRQDRAALKSASTSVPASTVVRSSGA